MLFEVDVSVDEEVVSVDVLVLPIVDEELDGDVEALVLLDGDVEDVVLPVVPLAPMLVVPVPEPVVPVLELLVLGEVDVLLLVLGEADVLLFGTEPLMPPALLSPACALVASGVLELLVPAPPPLCAKAMPPTARAAAAARVVSVFLVVLMSVAP